MQVEFVNALLADVLEVIERCLRSFESEELHAEEVVQIIRRNAYRAERWRWEKQNLLNEFATVVDGEVRIAAIFTGNLSAGANRLNGGFSLKTVLGQSVAEFRLFGCKALTMRSVSAGVAVAEGCGCALFSLPRDSLP